MPISKYCRTFASVGENVLFSKRHKSISKIKQIKYFQTKESANTKSGKKLSYYAKTKLEK